MNFRFSMSQLVFSMALAFCSTFANAGIVWNWQADVGHGGILEGTITTDGELVAGSAGSSTYTVTDFSFYTATDWLNVDSYFGSISDGQYVIGQPAITFDWDGSNATGFSRANGIYNNGFAFNHTTLGGYVGMSDSYFSVGEEFAPKVESYTAGVVLSVRGPAGQPTSVSEPATVALLALGMMGLATTRYKKKV